MALHFETATEKGLPRRSLVAAGWIATLGYWQVANSQAVLVFIGIWLLTSALSFILEMYSMGKGQRPNYNPSSPSRFEPPKQK